MSWPAAAARPPARWPGCACSRPPLPHRLLPTAAARGPPCRPRPRFPGRREAGGARSPPRSHPSHAASPSGSPDPGPCSAQKAKARRGRAPRSGLRRPLPSPPPPTVRLERRARDGRLRLPGLPAPTEPGSPAPATTRQPPALPLIPPPPGGGGDGRSRAGGDRAAVLPPF